MTEYSQEEFDVIPNLPHLETDEDNIEIDLQPDLFSEEDEQEEESCQDNDGHHNKPFDLFSILIPEEVENKEEGDQNDEKSWNDCNISKKSGSIRTTIKKQKHWYECLNCGRKQISKSKCKKGYTRIRCPCKDMRMHIKWKRLKLISEGN